MANVQYSNTSYGVNVQNLSYTEPISPKTVNEPKLLDVNIKQNKLCLRCELPFRQGIDDDKYRWCLECRQKKREKNRKERTTKKRKIVGNPSFAADNPNEDHFKKFDSFDEFLEYILHREIGEQTDAIYQTIFSEKQIPRFPKNFNFVSIGAKTVVKRRGFVTHVSGDDDEAMKEHIDAMQLAPVVGSFTSMKSANLTTTPLLSLAGIYVEKRVGLIIVSQTDSNSFFIQNSLKFLELIVAKLLDSIYKMVFELNGLTLTKLQDEISKLFAEHNIDQHEALQAYKFFKNKKFSMLRDLPLILSQFQVTPKLKNIDQAKLLRQTIDEQLIKFADKISNVTDYHYARKRRDVSQNGNFVINHYCRQDSHYRKFPTIENRKTEDCKSKLGLFYNCLNGDFKIIYSHKEHTKDFNEQNEHQPLPVDIVETHETNIDTDLISQTQQQQQHILNLQQQQQHPGIAVNALIPHAGDTNVLLDGTQPSTGNPQWRAYSNVLSFGNPNNDIGL